MKKKMILGILAAVLSLTLGISGTLMLFTDASESATNIVTLGKAEIKLYENTTDEFDSATESDGGNRTFSNADGEAPAPGDTVEKYAFVENAGTVDVYVYVKGEFSAKYADGSPVDFTATDDTTKAILADIQLILDEIEYNTGWIPGQTETPTASGITGYYYYATNDSGQLNFDVLDAGEHTDSIFKKIEIPLDVDNYLAGAELSLKLTAYAVQADNNPLTGADQSDQLKALISDAGF